MDTNNKVNELIYMLMQIIMTLTFIYSLINIYISPFNDIKAKYGFVSAQALCFLLCSFVPPCIAIMFKVKIPQCMIFIYLLYLICHFICGEIFSFYIKVEYWDSLLHFTSAFLLTFLAFSIFNSIAKIDTLDFMFVLCFSMAFAIATGGIWEIVEYLIDHIFKTNMQRYIDDNTFIELVGHFALKDTMKDMMLNFLGSLVSVIIIKCAGKDKFKNLTFKSIKQK